jgi:peptidoglycan-N-acetylmuramic acid deacetylase
MTRGRRAAAALLLALLLLAGPLLGWGGLADGPLSARAGVGDFVAGQPGCGRVALIFNVGAGYEPALGMLDTLSAYGVPATFFLMGWWVDWYPGAAATIAAYGHPIGSHGNLPPELTSRSDEDIRNDVWAAEAAFERQLGFAPGPWFTAYAGASDWRVNALVAELGYTMIGWEVETGDWDPNVSADMIHSRVMTQVYDGAVVELHLDSAGSTYTTATALPWIIEDLTAQGYTLVTIPDLMTPCS